MIISPNDRKMLRTASLALICCGIIEGCTIATKVVLQSRDATTNREALALIQAAIASGEGQSGEGHWKWEPSHAPVKLHADNCRFEAMLITGFELVPGVNA